MGEPVARVSKVERSDRGRARLPVVVLPLPLTLLLFIPPLLLLIFPADLVLVPRVLGGERSILMALLKTAFWVARETGRSEVGVGAPPPPAVTSLVSPLNIEEGVSVGVGIFPP